jgi:hypothetical protein
VVAIPPLLAGLVLNILQPHLPLCIVGRFASLDAFAAHLPSLAPDLVLTGAPAADDDDGVIDILRLHPDCCVLALLGGGRSAALYRSGRPAFVLADLSADALVTVVKQALLF